MHRNFEEIQKEIETVMLDLKKVAMEDNLITEEEQAIIGNIEENFQDMQTQIIQVLESDLGDEEFQDLIIDFLNDIVENAIHVANEDNVISKDEMKLLNKIKEFVNTQIDKGGRT